MKVRELMSDHVETLEPEDDLDLASMLMRLDRLHHLPVVEEGDLIGIISDRDVLRAQESSLRGLSSEESRRFDMRVKARDIMTVEVDTVTPDTSVDEALEKLRKRPYSCLPVLEDGQIVGIVTPTDFLDLLAKILPR